MEGSGQPDPSCRLVFPGFNSRTIIIKERLVTKEVKAHETSTSMVKAVPAELYAGSDIALKVKVSCPANCDLQGGQVGIADEEGAVVKEMELVSSDEAANETEEFVVRAPAKPGEYTWTAMFTAQEKEGILHEESSTPFSFSVKPHVTSVKVWDVPSPVVFDAAFKVKVGVRCSAGCNLTGKQVVIHDYEGVRVATATLGDVPWSTTGAQSCAEVELKAPGIESRYMWEVRFPEPDMELPHEESACTFALGVAGQPEHVVTVEVIDRETKTPLKKASVILRPSAYRGSEYSNYTDDAGVARVRVPKGEYGICATNGGYKSFFKLAEIASDIAVKAELLAGSDLDDIWG